VLPGPGELIRAQRRHRRPHAHRRRAARIARRCRGASASAPRVDADRDLDARRRPRAGDRVQRAGEQQVAEEPGTARADVGEPIEHDHVTGPHAELLDVLDLADALGLDGRELRGDLGTRGDLASDARDNQST
jgi:hypothetical protein